MNYTFLLSHSERAEIVKATNKFTGRTDDDRSFDSKWDLALMSAIWHRGNAKARELRDNGEYLSKLYVYLPNMIPGRWDIGDDVIIKGKARGKRSGVQMPQSSVGTSFYEFIENHSSRHVVPIGQMLRLQALVYLTNGVC